MDDREVERLERAFAGDREACSRLFAANWPIVYAWMLGFTRDRVEAEDLTQQAFLRAYTRLPQLRDPSRFLPWLRKIARTVALGGRRRAEPLLRAEPVGGDPEVTAETRETRQLVERSLGRLVARDRSLLLLLYVEELPLARIAVLFDMPVTTLRRRVARALERFRSAVERERRNHGMP